ncbi:MAG: amidohydrolase, partial [Planctomycetota bacterium]|nr:amidohydrolase [Planctomycetota bacterium]
MTIRQTAFLAFLFSTGLLFAQDKASSKPSAKNKHWTVNEKHSDEKTIAFETNEGTWISVDVSPDGSTLAFDLLGDIYTMPIAGGQAKSLTSGRAYDSQPRFSPDGKTVLFTSDRGGNDNLWIISLDGTKARPLTSQKDKVTNSGDWSPDGRHVIARRRLTDRSSIGTVELWLVDVNGGSGIQLTKKKQFGDANGPVFGPHGEALYFAGRKGRFEYNRNTDKGFWQLYRFDLETGELRRLSRSGGGSARPRVAPDGKKLAFVRRIRGKSCLFLYDLQSGAETQITDTLDPDMQEAFAWTGAYPGYDWLPDSKEIVYSASGKLWRWNLA